MEIIGTVEQLRRTIAGWRAQAMRTALVPTMGALHDGHIALVHQALRLADRIVVSIFVNPKQFGAHEDLGKYPRDEAGDRRKLKEAGAHLIYAPATLEMYPEGFATEVALSGPATVGLEDRFRPHFFAGVATAVAKLFIQAGCDYAMFGEKDYQQLKVVTRMAGDLDIPTVVIPVATVRESDGLAMSSRNAYLSRAERLEAPLIHRELTAAADAIGKGAAPADAAAAAALALTEAGFRVDYVEARNADTLAELHADSDPVRLLAAAWLGATRLIDNIAA